MTFQIVKDPLILFLVILTHTLACAAGATCTIHRIVELTEKQMGGQIVKSTRFNLFLPSTLCHPVGYGSHFPLHTFGSARKVNSFCPLGAIVLVGYIATMHKIL